MCVYEHKSMNGRVSFTNLLCYVFFSTISTLTTATTLSDTLAYLFCSLFFHHSSVLFRNVQRMFSTVVWFMPNVCLHEDKMRACKRETCAYYFTCVFFFFSIFCHSCLAKPANQHKHRRINNTRTLTVLAKVNTGLYVVVVAVSAIHTSFRGCWLAWECIARQYRFEWARQHITPQRVKSSDQIHRFTIEIHIETATKMHFKAML